MPSIVRELCGMESPPKALGGPQQKGTSTNDPACPIARGTNRRLFKHDDSAPRHLALPPARRRPGVGVHQEQQPPLGASECTTIRGPIRAPLRGRTHRILDEDMRQLRPHRQRPDRAQPGGQKSIPGQQSLPGNRQDLGGVPWVRCRPHQAIEAWRRRCARQHAVADDGGGKDQGQDRISSRSRRSSRAATIWACCQSV